MSVLCGCGWDGFLEGVGNSEVVAVVGKWVRPCTCSTAWPHSRRHTRGLVSRSRKMGRVSMAAALVSSRVTNRKWGWLSTCQQGTAGASGSRRTGQRRRRAEKNRWPKTVLGWGLHEDGFQLLDVHGH